MRKIIAVSLTVLMMAYQTIPAYAAASYFRWDGSDQQPTRNIPQTTTQQAVTPSASQAPNVGWPSQSFSIGRGGRTSGVQQNSGQTTGGTLTSSNRGSRRGSQSGSGSQSGNGSQTSTSSNTVSNTSTKSSAPTSTAPVSTTSNNTSTGSFTAPSGFVVLESYSNGQPKRMRQMVSGSAKYDFVYFESASGTQFSNLKKSLVYYHDNGNVTEYYASGVIKSTFLNGSKLLRIFSDEKYTSQYGNWYGRVLQETRNATSPYNPNSGTTSSSSTSTSSSGNTATSTSSSTTNTTGSSTNTESSSTTSNPTTSTSSPTTSTRVITNTGMIINPGHHWSTANPWVQSSSTMLADYTIRNHSDIYIGQRINFGLATPYNPANDAYIASLKNADGSLNETKAWAEWIKFQAEWARNNPGGTIGPWIGIGLESAADRKNHGLFPYDNFRIEDFQNLPDFVDSSQTVQKAVEAPFDQFSSGKINFLNPYARQKFIDLVKAWYTKYVNDFVAACPTCNVEINMGFDNVGYGGYRNPTTGSNPFWEARSSAYEEISAFVQQYAASKGKVGSVTFNLGGWGWHTGTTSQQFLDMLGTPGQPTTGTLSKIGKNLILESIWSSTDSTNYQTKTNTQQIISNLRVFLASGPDQSISLITTGGNTSEVLFAFLQFVKTSATNQLYSNTSFTAPPADAYTDPSQWNHLLGNPTGEVQYTTYSGTDQLSKMTRTFQNGSLELQIPQNRDVNGYTIILRFNNGRTLTLHPTR